MTIKYTQDGKKVSVVGKINNTQFIVQELFISGENEFPAGDNFVVSCLLDTQAETVKTREEKQIQATITRLKEKEELANNLTCISLADVT